MSPRTPLELAEPLRFEPLNHPTAESIVRAALVARPDYLSLASQRHQLVEQQQASRARYFPKLSLSGNYGGLGRSVGGVQGTYIVQGQIDFTLFDRDRNGEAQELASRVKRIDDQIADLRRGIEQDRQTAARSFDGREDC